MSELAEVLPTVRLSTNGDKLHVEPVGGGELAPALLDRLRTGKPGIMPLLRDYALAVVDSRIRERGEIPSHYTSRTIGKGCGPVPIFAGCAAHVDSCPWCWNRLKDLAVPRVSPCRN